MKKSVLLLACAFSVMSAAPAYAGQLIVDETGIRYVNDDGSLKTGWHQEGENGPWYYFKEDGYATTDWIRDNGQQYYFRPENGQMVMNRITTLGDRMVYEFNEDGACTAMWDFYNGWLLDDSGWQYRNLSQSLVTGWKQIDGQWYYFDEAGYMKTGFVEVDGVTYYLDDNGVMVHDEIRVINGVPYEFESSGAVAGNITVTVPTDWPYKPATEDVPETEKSDYRKAVDAMADSILAGIVNDSMNKRQKAEAIYAWVRGNFRYNGHSATRDWVEEAYQGLRRRHGDCYTYFSVSQELLIRCGIPSIEVIRYTDNNHYWNLVQLDDGNWYHFDTTPRRAGGYFCLWTDAQMLHYSAAHNNCFAFDRALYPPTP